MIEARGLGKRYGATAAVDDLTFTIRPGMVTGFLGPNGACETTTMRLILGLDHPSAGSVTVNDRPYLVGLADVAGKRSKGFSLGMRQRLGIAPIVDVRMPPTHTDEGLRARPCHPRAVLSLIAQGRSNAAIACADISILIRNG